VPRFAGQPRDLRFHRDARDSMKFMVKGKNSMNRTTRNVHGRAISIFAAMLAVALGGSLALSAPARAQYQLVQVSTDKFTNTDSDHKTEVEPHTFSWGSTIVSAYHVARRPGSIGWGSADIGFSTSTNGGSTWTYGYLPGMTVNYKGGTFGATADPAVAYDTKHGGWLIVALPLVGLNGNGNTIGDVSVSRSADGIHWGNPILIDQTALDDKTWIVCDNTSTSKYYGNCYVEWDQAYGTGDVLMSVSSDGGATWTAGQPSADHAGGLGGVPLVQPNGTVIVPFEGGGIDVFTSTNGGSSWGTSEQIADIDSHYEDNIRNPNLPASGIDGAGNVFVAWSDCRFRSGCAENDIVYSSSADGKTWSAVTRIPIDPVTSTVDHFLPGFGVNPTTSGKSAGLTVVYYYFPIANCSNSCQLDVGFSSSSNGGQTWTSGVQLAGPMQLSWLPVSDNGPMVADYVGVAYNNNNPFSVFAVALAPQGSTLREAMATTKQPLIPAPDVPRFSAAADKPVPGAKSDHVMNFYYDDEGTRPIPQSRWIKPQAR